ncbi:MAG: hypothetical protein RIR79_758 [Pseudomonadota bacterium]|jgi:predicted ATPase
MITFRIIQRNDDIPKNEKNTYYLQVDRWNDYSFVTMFNLCYRDQQGSITNIGNIKIGFKGQTKETPTFQKIPSSFQELTDEFFSLGESIDYYKSIHKIAEKEQILSALRDIVHNDKIIPTIEDEEVFSTSLLRETSLTTIKGQFRRILDNKPELTPFEFRFTSPAKSNFDAFSLVFRVSPEKKPRTNIHAIIGRNGAGKTTILNEFVKNITKQPTDSKIIELGGSEKEISNDYFSNLVSISFSAFDTFSPPQNQSDPAKGTCYFYIGLKNDLDSSKNKSIAELRNECFKSLTYCFGKAAKRDRWRRAIEKLGSDINFSQMFLTRLIEKYDQITLNNGNREELKEIILHVLEKMSSGHFIILLIVTKLIETVEEKTLVILDEPESHLHPPLLSAFIRALSDLLDDRNGVAIIATHSPVILQEIPRHCVWKLFRTGSNINTARPRIETFGENVGTLTREIFGLEVEASGFHELLSQSVASGKSYSEILEEYNDHLGIEGRAILGTLISIRNSDEKNDAA